MGRNGREGCIALALLSLELSLQTWFQSTLAHTGKGIKIPFASLSAMSGPNEICHQLHRPHGYHGKSLRFILISFRVQHKPGAQLTGGAGQRTLCPLQLIPEYLASSPQTHPNITRMQSQPKATELLQASRTSGLHEELSCLAGLSVAGERSFPAWEGRQTWVSMPRGPIIAAWRQRNHSSPGHLDLRT